MFKLKSYIAIILTTSCTITMAFPLDKEFRLISGNSSKCAKAVALGSIIIDSSDVDGHPEYVEGPAFTLDSGFTPRIYVNINHGKRCYTKISGELSNTKTCEVVTYKKNGQLEILEKRMCEVSGLFTVFSRCDVNHSVQTITYDSSAKNLSIKTKDVDVNPKGDECIYKLKK